MEWNAYLVAIRLASDAARVHIVERRYLEPTGAAYQYVNIKTCCEVELTSPCDECQQEEIILDKAFHRSALNELLIRFALSERMICNEITW